MDIENLFSSNSDCYADTWHENHDTEPPTLVEGEVVLAMTKEGFEKAIAELQDKSIYTDAIIAWGERFQFDMWHEEVGELMQAISKMRRKPSKKKFDHVCEEIADVMLMTEQLSHCVDHELVMKYKQKKMERLQRRIDKSNEN